MKLSLSLKIGSILLFLGLFFPLRLLALIPLKETFYVEPSYDLLSRERVEAQLIKAGKSLIFYGEKDWLDSLSSQEKKILSQKVEQLDLVFKKEIYPKLTSLLGSEWKPGIDGEFRIFVLFHNLKGDYAGYTREIDEFPKSAVPTSNQKEIIYLNPKLLGQSFLKEVLAHEFTHLIFFNQKTKNLGIEEPKWVQELVAEASTIYLGYDISSQDSYFSRRIKKFLSDPSDPLLDWEDKEKDYALVYVLSAYLINHFGGEFLNFLLKSPFKGILAIEESLKKSKVKMYSFKEIFLNWAIAQVIGDCQDFVYYCYNHPVFEGLRISPRTIFLPPWGENKITTKDFNFPYTGKWYKIVGGKEQIKLSFKNLEDSPMILGLVVLNKKNGVKIEKLELKEKEEKVFYFEDFLKKKKSLILVPLVFDYIDPLRKHYFKFEVAKVNSFQDSNKKILSLLKEIERLKAIIKNLQAKIQQLLVQKKNSFCKIQNNLYFGIRSKEVECLQRFLALQGPSIYPEALVTGYFGQLTLKAVIRFQEKYKDEILVPIGLDKGTGFVGPLTRAKINQLLSW